MTEAEWRACENPSKMRKQILPRGFRVARWLHFHIACVQRVRHLLNAPAVKWLDNVSGLSGAGLTHALKDGKRWSLSSEDHLQVYELSERIRRCRTKAARRRLMNQADFAALCAFGWVGPFCSLAASNWVCVAVGRCGWPPAAQAAARAERREHASLMRCVFRSTLSPVPLSPAWRTSTVVALAAQMYQSQDFSAMPILGDALQDAGCDSPEVLDHCRAPGAHVRGCWVVDLVLGKE